MLAEARQENAFSWKKTFGAGWARFCRPCIDHIGPSDSKSCWSYYIPSTTSCIASRREMEENENPKRKFGQEIRKERRADQEGHQGLIESSQQPSPPCEPRTDQPK